MCGFMQLHTLLCAACFEMRRGSPFNASKAFGNTSVMRDDYTRSKLASSRGAASLASPVTAGRVHSDIRTTQEHAENSAGANALVVRKELDPVASSKCGERVSARRSRDQNLNLLA